MEDDPPRLLLGESQHLVEVPGNRLALAIEVGRQINLRRFGGSCRQLLDHVALLVGHPVAWCEVVFHIHRQLRAQQVAHVPHRRLDRIPLAQETPHRARLGRRLHDDQLPRRLRRLGLRRRFHPGVHRGFTHAEHLGLADRTVSLCRRLPLSSEHGSWLDHLPFLPALHTIRYNFRLFRHTPCHLPIQTQQPHHEPP